MSGQVRDEGRRGGFLGRVFIARRALPRQRPRGSSRLQASVPPGRRHLGAPNMQTGTRDQEWAWMRWPVSRVRSFSRQVAESDRMAPGLAAPRRFHDIWTYASVARAYANCWGRANRAAGSTLCAAAGRMRPNDVAPAGREAGRRRRRGPRRRRRRRPALADGRSAPLGPARPQSRASRRAAKSAEHR